MIGEYTGKKWRCVGKKTVRDEYGDVKEKGDFRMTRQYVQYLGEKHRQELYNDIVVQKGKIEQDIELYGDADSVDVDYLSYLVQEYNRQYGNL